MQIEKNLPQFNEEKALLIVTGERSAKLYSANQGFIEELALFHIVNPVYSDREGSFGKSMGQTRIVSGAAYEMKQNLKLDLHTKFLHKLKQDIDDVQKKNKFNVIFLFSPDFIAKDIYKNMTREVSDLIRLKVKGNFVEEHPFKLLQRIKKEYESLLGSKTPINEEAVKLLKPKKEIK
ncbi:MAG: hypothetical protein UT48_C0010G0073 [Parcubacteria group bacterium GW2011_GWE2_39_37]|uniref:Host attachment protein n=1 Tax=Candidatus Falkowbacteria bacterium GW2011_GWF2_39_8 TaxID=1618642 RepID=A0A0G0PU86_9BACT|nr:MAG: hypothetical protein UT48_C0010G0073 [Parcubacteria group bacterium GW2011_GWE2_39_37]KKR31488.1 MAG: hypothetical protein UT64_C0059G0011 [Candidatus Falkowbacteria bacterium GW2011_GWF2_39_8]